jgi:hypothetical protein
VFAVVGVFAWRHDRRETGTYVTGFALVGGDTAADLTRLRQQRHLTIGVSDGICAGTDERPPEQRFERVELRETREQVVGTVRMRQTRGEVCSGVGQGFTATVRLARPIGPRALIDYEGPYQFRRILIPPRDPGTVRRLVLPIRRDHKQPPPLIYTQPACDLVARYLTDVPKAQWCEF